MNESGTLREQYTGEGVRATLACRWGRCRFDVTFDRWETHRDAAMVEVLAQPRNPARLPEGPPLLLHRCEMIVRRSRDGTRMFGSCLLPPNLTPAVARDCYYRVFAA